MLIFYFLFLSIIWTWKLLYSSNWSRICTPSLVENNEAFWCVTTMGHNERSRLFRTHESPSVHLGFERPLRNRRRDATEVCWLHEGVPDLMMEATAESFTLLTSGWRRDKIFWCENTERPTMVINTVNYSAGERIYAPWTSLTFVTLQTQTSVYFVGIWCDSPV